MFFAWLVLTKESWAEECLYSKKQISTIKVQNISDHFRILIFIVCPGQGWKKRWGRGRRRGRRSVSWVGPSGKLPRALWRDQLALRWQNTHKFQQNCFPKWANRIPLLTRRTISTDLRSNLHVRSWSSADGHYIPVWWAPVLAGFILHWFLPEILNKIGRAGEFGWLVGIVCYGTRLV